MNKFIPLSEAKQIEILAFLQSLKQCSYKRVFSVENSKAILRCFFYNAADEQNS